MFGVFSFTFNAAKRQRLCRKTLLAPLQRAGISLTFLVAMSCQSVATRGKSPVRNVEQGVLGVTQEPASPDGAKLTAAAPNDALPQEGEVAALCTVRESAGGVVHRLEFLFNNDLSLYEVDHISIDGDLQESFRSYFARGNLRRDRIVLDLQESINGNKFAELKAEPRGEQGLLLGTIVFTQLRSQEQDNAECSVNY